MKDKNERREQYNQFIDSFTTSVNKLREYGISDKAFTNIKDTLKPSNVTAGKLLAELIPTHWSLKIVKGIAKLSQENQWGYRSINETMMKAIKDKDSLAEEDAWRAGCAFFLFEDIHFAIDYIKNKIAKLYDVQIDNIGQYMSTLSQIYVLTSHHLAAQHFQIGLQSITTNKNSNDFYQKRSDSLTSFRTCSEWDIGHVNLIMGKYAYEQQNYVIALKYLNRDIRVGGDESQFFRGLSNYHLKEYKKAASELRLITDLSPFSYLANEYLEKAVFAKDDASIEKNKRVTSSKFRNNSNNANNQTALYLQKNHPEKVVPVSNPLQKQGIFKVPRSNPNSTNEEKQTQLYLNKNHPEKIKSIATPNNLQKEKKQTARFYARQERNNRVQEEKQTQLYLNKNHPEKIKSIATPNNLQKERVQTEMYYANQDRNKYTQNAHKVNSSSSIVTTEGGSPVTFSGGYVKTGGSDNWGGNMSSASELSGYDRYYDRSW